MKITTGQPDWATYKDWTEWKDRTPVGVLKYIAELEARELGYIQSLRTMEAEVERLRVALKRRAQEHADRLNEHPAMQGRAKAESQWEWKQAEGE